MSVIVRKQPREVVAVVVTYGSRADHCSRVVDAALAQGCTAVVVVSNGTEAAALRRLRHRWARVDAVDVVELDENLGSAGGYAVGIEKAATDHHGSLLWLLDDDNLPAHGALAAAVRCRDHAVDVLGTPKVATSSLRPANKYQRARVGAASHTATYPGPGSFLYFDLRRRLGPRNPIRRLRKARDPAPPRATVLDIPYAPYGGLLLDAEVVDTVGTPQRQLRLYEDDTDFTERMTRAGYTIVLAPDSEIHDLDPQWTSGDTGSGLHRLLAATDRGRQYYAVRNRVLFDRRRAAAARCGTWYRVNRAIYLGCLRVVAVRVGGPGSLHTVVAAAADGHHGRFDRGPSL